MVLYYIRGTGFAGDSLFVSGNGSRKREPEAAPEKRFFVEQQADEEKSRLRRLYGSKRKELSPEWRRRNDPEIRARLRELPAYRETVCAAFFVAWGAEPDLSELFLEKRTFLPRFSAELESYEMVEITDPKRDLLPGKYGIPEPRPDLPAAPADLLREEVLFVVPAVACTPEGIRLGRGGGYYDRLLAGVKKAPVAVVYSCQIAPFLPCAGHDCRMGAVVTENKTWSCRKLPGADTRNGAQKRGQKCKAHCGS